MIRSKLSFIAEEISRQNENVLSFYNEGISFKSATAIAGNALPSELNDLFALYEWHNGLKNWEVPTDESAIFPFGVFLSIQDAVNGQKDAVKFDLYRNNYFPILGDDTLLINTDSHSDTFRSIFLLSPAMAIVSPVKVYSSLDSFLASVLKAYQQRAIYYSADGKFVIDYTKFFNISRALNPDIEYWKN